MKGGDYVFAGMCMACCLYFVSIIVIHQAENHDARRVLHRYQLEKSKAELAAVLAVITNSPKYKELLILQTNEGGVK